MTAIPMLTDDHRPRELGHLDECVAEACVFLAARGLRVGIEFHVDDAVTIAVEMIGAAK